MDTKMSHPLVGCSTRTPQLLLNSSSSSTRAGVQLSGTSTQKSQLPRGSAIFEKSKLSGERKMESTMTRVQSGGGLRSSLMTSSMLSNTGLQSSLFSSRTTTCSSSLVSSKIKLSSPLLTSLSGPSVTSSLGRTSKLTSSLLPPKSLLPSREASVPAKDKVKKKKDGKKKKDASMKKVNKEFEEVDDVTEMPMYDFADGREEIKAIDLPKFIPPERDAQLIPSISLTENIKISKVELLNAVSSSLLSSPDFKKASDPMRLALISSAGSLVPCDPEFILKLALYTRNELNIRTTANFLLAFAANTAECRPYLRKYYNTCIRLPSDWIEVAEQYQVFHDKTLATGALPSALRRVMVKKFPSFDKYQLAKYNKEGSMKKKKKREAKKKQEKMDKDDAELSTRGRGGRGRGGRGRGGRGRWTRGMRGGRGRGRMPPQKRGLFDSDTSSDDSSGSISDSSSSDDEEEMKVKRQWSGKSDTEEDMEQQRFTLKQLIRKLHLTEPVEHVMCLIGKRYPSDLESFYASRLPGTWEEERAGKRMKLPTPETWETQVAMKGNKAATWEALLDHNKLPFMAMLRNLRNMIKAGVSEKHHVQVIRKLTNVGAVANSRQFPFRFFSAYEVLTQLEEGYHSNQAAIVQAAEEAASRGEGHSRGRGRGRGQGRGGSSRGRGRGGKRDPGQPPAEVLYDEALLARYKKALDTAVKIATIHNVAPIRGQTIIFCQFGPCMRNPCSSARGLGAPRTLAMVAVLLGLMCKYSCEDCQMIVYGNHGYRTVKLEKGTILSNMDSVMELDQVVNSSDVTGDLGVLPMDIIETLFIDRKQIDNLILLDQSLIKDADVCDDSFKLKAFLKKYRHFVNPNLLFVNVDLGFRQGKSEIDESFSHPNNVNIAGYSDQILRFIAERGSGSQLTHVEKIADAYNLEPLPHLKLATPTGPERPLALPAIIPRWRTARVFISSTFRDMHGERDLLTRFIMPELRARAEKQLIHVYEVDLRWGVTEEQTRSNRTLELCLDELSRCHFFLGILGERYGWEPDKNAVPDSADYDWIRNFTPENPSMTHLEIHAAALSRVEEAQETAFFYFRNNGFETHVPGKWKEDFASESPSGAMKMNKLKTMIRQSGLEVFDGYPCSWNGVVNGKPMVSDLEEFGARVLSNMWNAIEKYYPAEEAVLSETDHITGQHEAFIGDQQKRFVGRANLLKQCLATLHGMPADGGLLILSGKAGTGKTALMSSLVNAYVESKQCASGLHVVTHFLGAAPGSTNALAMLRRLCHELARRFHLNMDLPEEYKNMVLKFEELLLEAAKICTSALVVFIDGLDLLDPAYHAQTLNWLPSSLPKNVVVVVSVKEKTPVSNVLSPRAAQRVTVGPLDLNDKAVVVRQTLAMHSKKLDESPFNNQLKLLVSKRDGNIPLFLTLACEELRVFGQYEKMTDKVKSLAHTVPQLLQQVITRLHDDHGNLAVMAIFFLGLSRQGLNEVDLRAMLSIFKLLTKQGEIPSTIDAVWFRLEADSFVPAALFARLMRALSCFLRPVSSHSCQLMLTNTDIGDAVRLWYKQYNSKPLADLVKSLQDIMAGYYYDQAYGESSWNGTNEQAFSELPYHMAAQGNYDGLQNVLCDLLFIQSKCQFGLALQLLDDFLSWGELSPEAEKAHAKFMTCPKVQDYLSFIRRNLHILKSHPRLTLQQARLEPSGTAVSCGMASLVDWGLGDTDMDSMIDCQTKTDKSDPCMLTLNQLSQVATCVAISPDGSHFTAGFKDCVARVYELQTGKEVAVFTGHSNEITGVCWVGSDKVCTASADSTLSLWSASSSHRIAVMKSHKRKVSHVASDPKGETIISTGWDCSVVAWEGKTGKFKYPVDTVTNTHLSRRPVNCIAFDPSDPNRIVTGCWDSAVRIWDVFNKARKAVLRGHTSSVRDVAFSPSGRHIASAALDGEVKLWFTANGVQVGNIHGHGLPINGIAFSPRSNALVTVADDCQIKLWSEQMGNLIWTVGQQELGPAVSVAIHPEGKQVVCGYHEGHVRLYSASTGVEEFVVKPHKASVRSIKFSPDGLHILSASDDCSIKVMRCIDGEEAGRLVGNGQPVMSVAYGTTFIVSTATDGSVNLYKARNITDRKVKEHKPLFTLSGHTGPVTCCAFNASQTKLVTGSRDASLFIWDVQQIERGGAMKPENIFHACHSDWINDCAWSNTGDFIVTGSNDFTIKLWDAKTGKEKVKMVGHMSAVNSVAFKYGCIVSTCYDGTSKVWSHKGTEITTLHGHSQRVNGCDIYVKVTAREEEEDEPSDWATMTLNEEWKEKHEDIKLDKKSSQVEEVVVATCSDDGTTSLWYPNRSNELACYTGHSDKVTAVACGDDGTLCTAALDNTIKLWKPTQTDTAASRVARHDSEVTVVVIEPVHRRYILTGGRDGAVMVWYWGDPSSSQNVPNMVLSSKVHNKAVKGACFIGSEAGHVVTCSDDSTIKCWQLIKRGDTVVSLREQCNVRTGKPVSHITATSARSSRVIAMENNHGGFTVYDMMTGDVVTACSQAKPDLIFDLFILAMCMGSSGQLLAVSSVNDLTVWADPENQVDELFSVTLDWDSYNEDTKPWVTCMVALRDTVLLGNTAGVISLYNNQGAPLICKKIHSGPVTACTSDDHSTFITASADGTLKTWDPQLNQLGLFFCQAPVSSMDLSTTKLELKNGKQVISYSLLCGDSLGNLKVFTWQHQKEKDQTQVTGHHRSSQGEDAHLSALWH